MPEVDGNQLMWLEEDAEDENPQQEQIMVQAVQLSAVGAGADSEHSAAINALEDELQRTRRELMDVRKELAAKTVQLSRKEVIVSQEKVAELAAHVASEKDKQLSSLAAHVEQLELVLGQKEEELEESRRLYNAQKRALREALSAAAEAEAAERLADEARARTAVAQVVEDELDRLQHDLALLQARYDLEMRARDTELQALRSELQAANANRKQAVAAAEAALTEAWQAELGRATEEATGRVAQLEAEMARVRQQLEDHARNGDTVGLAGELASLNQQKVAVQREFDAFRELATTTSREHREAAARLLEENASLKGRLAARAFQDVQAGFKPQTKVFTALTSAAGGAHGGALGVAPSASPSRDFLLGPGNAWMEHLPEVLLRLERQRKGLLPVLALGTVVILFVMVAVVRAAAVTRSEHRGGLCFLAHLGINVGPGCGLKHTHSVSEVASEELGHLLDAAPRVHDLEGVAEEAAAAEAAAAEAAATEAAAEAVAEGGVGRLAAEQGAGAEALEAGEIGAVDPIIAAAAAQGAEAAAAAAGADSGAAGADDENVGVVKGVRKDKRSRASQANVGVEQQLDSAQELEAVGAEAPAAGAEAAAAEGGLEVAVRQVGEAGTVGVQQQQQEEGQAEGAATGGTVMEAAMTAARLARLLLHQQKPQWLEQQQQKRQGKAVVLQEVEEAQAQAVRQRRNRRALQSAAAATAVAAARQAR